MPISAEAIISRTREAGQILPCKFVRTTKGYYLGIDGESHASLVPEGEQAISAGMLMVMRGKEALLLDEGSLTLEIDPKPDDVEGLASLLGVPVKQMALRAVR